jgi:hypothetical protein
MFEFPAPIEHPLTATCATDNFQNIANVLPTASSMQTCFYNLITFASDIAHMNPADDDSGASIGAMFQRN